VLFYQTPYTRFLQLARVAAQERAREQRDELRQAALVGYQFYICQPMEKGRRHKTFAQWLQGFGLADTAEAPELSDEQKEQMRRKAEDNERKVIELFRRKKKH
jgi:hypothetical protein